MLESELKMSAFAVFPVAITKANGKEGRFFCRFHVRVVL